MRSSPHSSNNPTRAKHNLPSSSTPSREVLRQPYKCSLVLLAQFLTIKIDLALLCGAERLHSFFKIAHLDEMSGGMFMHGKRGKCSQCLVRVTQPSQRIIKIMLAEKK